MAFPTGPEREKSEWLEADGLGGFASGTVSGIRTRRYHALLLAATSPPAGRMALVNGFDAEVETAAGRFALTTQRYSPGVDSPDGVTRFESFDVEPWPQWTHAVPGGKIVHELFVPRERAAVVLRWRWRAKPGRRCAFTCGLFSRAAIFMPRITRTRCFGSGRKARPKASAGIFTRMCPGSPPAATARIATNRAGTGIFSTTRISPWDSMPWKIWPRRAATNSTWPPDPPS